MTSMTNGDMGDTIADEESGDEVEVSTEEATSKYQKTFSTLKLLPYSEILDDETDEYFERILRNISKTILCADFQVGLLTYTRSLKGYIHLYGLKLTKLQHIKLVRLYYEVITMESCPLALIYDFADMYNTLLKKSILLKREDITIPWRPLFNTLDRCIHHRKYTLSASTSLKLERVLKEAIRHSNVYFESDIVQDIIDEFQPYLCPSSPKMAHGLKMLNIFLPFLSENDEAQINKYLAFLLEFSKVWNNGPTWDWTMMGVLGKAAWNMHGSFDWTPYLPLVYSRLLKGLELPVYFKGTRNIVSTESAKNFDFRAAASWIVATLGNRPEAMKNLKNFLETVETYFNPLNQGRWSLPLLSLLNELVTLFTIRLKRERYENSGKRWWQRLKPERMLTDEDVEEFVLITSEVVLDFYLDLQSSGFLLKHLAYIRPDIIIPAVLEKYEGMVETVTEPRKYLIALRWVTVIIVPMACCRKDEDGFDGRKFMIPFAMSLLPAIDPNDMLKTMSALGIIHCIFSVVPFVDCSSLSGDIEDEELRDLAIATGCLEDFSLQFIDRVISLIENRTHENTRMADSRITSMQAINAEDSGLEKFIWAVFHRLATHSSTKILKAMSKKLTAYALSTTLETDVSGRLFASILQAFTVVRPDIMLPKLLPGLCNLIQEAITDDILDDEELEKTLQFHLLELSFISETVGTELLKYKDDIDKTISAILKLNGKRGYEFASSTILRLLNSLVLTYPLDNRISQSDIDDPKYLAVEEWGLTMEPKEVICKWHIPNAEELEWAKTLFLRVYTEYAGYLNQPGTLTQSNDALNKKLLKIIQVLQCTLEGIQTVVPFWDDVPIISEETVMELEPVRMEFGLSNIDIRDPFTNELIKKSYFEMYTKIKAYLDAYKSDDTEAYVAVIRGFDNLIIPNFEPDRRMVLPLKSNHSTNLNNSLKPKKKFSRALHIARAFETHLKRVRTSACTTWTNSHHEIMKKLFELCVNRYAKVRIFAQGRFCRIIDAFSGAVTRGLSTLFIEKLQPGVSHDEYKGTLYTILTCKVSPVLTNSWEEIRALWIALLRSPFSEKNSIIKCMDAIRKVISHSFIFFPTREEGSPSLNNLAQELVPESTLKSFGELKFLKSRDLNDGIFNSLLTELIESASKGNNHWRQKILCANMISVLITEKMILPKQMVEYFFESMVAKTPEIRSNALSTLNWLLALFKRKYPFVTVDTRTGFKFAEGESIHSVLQYKSDPAKDASLNGRFVVTDINGQNVPRFRIHKPYFGFTPLPLRIEVKQPPHSFADLTREPVQPQPVQVVVEVTKTYMENAEYLKNLLEVWTQEDRSKGLAVKRTQILKCIARNNGLEALKLILGMVPKLGKDKDQWKQRCIADILSGILHGVKSWNEESVAELWTIMEPILHDSLDNVTQETMKYWGAAMIVPNSSRDPNKLRFFIEFMKARFIASLETAHTTSVDAFKNMSFFDNVIANLHWRGGDIFPEILNLVKIHILDHPIPYVTVRDQLGRLLGDVFEWAVESPVKMQCEVAPKYEPFVESVFDALQNIIPEASKYQANKGETEENAEARKLLLKYKSAVEWLVAVCWDMETTIPPVLYRLVPLLCHFESYDPDPEVAQLTTVALSGLSRMLLLPENVEPLLIQLQQVASTSPSWRARLCVVEFLKVLALNNTNIFASNEKFSDTIIKLVLVLLSDRKIEVRALASSVLSGFLHCLIVQKPMELLSTFQKEAQKFALRRKKGLHASPKLILSPEDIDTAHSTILGLCAFVEAHPYDCPEFLPDVLVTLSTHLHDPEPIPSTLRKCLLNFRRTHHDNWSVHKTKFSEDQLCILTDIFVSPCYYA